MQFLEANIMSIKLESVERSDISERHYDISERLYFYDAFPINNSNASEIDDLLAY